MQNTNFTLVAIVGLAGSGKSVASDYFKQRGFTPLRLGDLTDTTLLKMHKIPNPQTERDVRETIRKISGMDAYAKWAVEQIKKISKDTNKIVLDGLRSWEEYCYLKDRYFQLHVIYLFSSPTIRYQRLEQRHKRPLTQSEAQQRDLDEIDHLHMGPTLALANEVVINDGSIGQLEEKLERIIANNL